MPPLPAGPIFQSSESSKSPNSSFVTRSVTGVVFASVPSMIFQPSGTVSLLYPRQWSSDFPSKSVCQPLFAAVLTLLCALVPATISVSAAAALITLVHRFIGTFLLRAHSLLLVREPSHVSDTRPAGRRTVVRTGREVQRSRGQGAQWSSSPLASMTHTPAAMLSRLARQRT